MMTGTVPWFWFWFCGDAGVGCVIVGTITIDAPGKPAICPAIRPIPWPPVGNPFGNPGMDPPGGFIRIMGVGENCGCPGLGMVAEGGAGGAGGAEGAAHCANRRCAPASAAKAAVMHSVQTRCQ